PRPRVVLASPADVHRGLDAQVLRLSHRRLHVALVFPHRLHRPNRARRRSLPQKRRGPILRLLLSRQEDAAGRGRELRLTRSQERFCHAQQLSQPYSVAEAFFFAARVHPWRGEAPVAQEQDEAATTVLREHGFSMWGAMGTILRGGILAERGEEGLS
ncbi:MAG: hypothetical protein O7G29_10905, partial [Acidobacteria bacterium]|nr:hypothetical protein [Acidobacteriota bacterium]